MNLLKRLNIVLLVLVVAVVVGCEKRKRLTNSTFSFRISPSAAAVQPNGTVALVAQGPGASETVWTVSPDTAGVITPSIGASVTFTAGANIGQANVTATLGDSIARMNIGVVDYAGNPYATDKFDVYTDQGLPPPPLSSDIDVGPNNDPLQLSEISTEFGPEGLKYLRATATNASQFWDVTLNDNGSGQSKDLSSFAPINSAGATLKFSIRLNRALSGDGFTVEYKDSSDRTKSRTSTGANWPGFDGTQANVWHDVAIPLSNFAGPGAFDFGVVVVPFSIKVTAWTGTNGPLTFDIDGVRWEQ